MTLMISGNAELALSVVMFIVPKGGLRVHLKISLGHVHNVETSFNHILFTKKKSFYV